MINLAIAWVLDTITRHTVRPQLSARELAAFDNAAATAQDAGRARAQPGWCSNQTKRRRPLEAALRERDQAFDALTRALDDAELLRGELHGVNLALREGGHPMGNGRGSRPEAVRQALRTQRGELEQHAHGPVELVAAAFEEQISEFVRLRGEDPAEGYDADPREAARVAVQTLRAAGHLHQRDHAAARRARRDAALLARHDRTCPDGARCVTCALPRRDDPASDPLFTVRVQPGADPRDPDADRAWKTTHTWIGDEQPPYWVMSRRALRLDDADVVGWPRQSLAELATVMSHDVGPELTSEARASGCCSQCGQPFAEWACGPTHAVAAAVYFGGTASLLAVQTVRYARDEARRERDELLAERGRTVDALDPGNDPGDVALDDLARHALTARIALAVAAELRWWALRLQPRAVGPLPLAELYAAAAARPHAPRALAGRAEHLNPGGTWPVSDEPPTVSLFRTPTAGEVDRSIANRPTEDDEMEVWPR